MIFAATQIYGSHGGIPSYMRRLSEIFSTLSAEQNFRFSAVSLNDLDWDQTRHKQPVRYDAFIGCGGERGRFVQRLFALAAKQSGQSMVLGHVALAPLAYALRRAGLIRSYIVVLHGTEAWQRMRWRERIACRAADRIVATTLFTESRFAEVNGVRREGISVVPLAVDNSCSELTAPGTEARSPHQPLRVLFVGRLTSIERYKGLDELLEAVSLLASEGLPMDLQISGSGDDLARLVQKARDLHIEQYATFHGSLDEIALEQAYRDCDLFALPSRGEGFGIVFLEAMSYGKPCLGADCGGIPEVIDHGRDGYLVRYGDALDISGRLRELSENRNLLRALGERAYKKVWGKYLFSNMLENWRPLISDDVGAESSRRLAA